MQRCLVDTNVIIDAADPDSQWYAWSAAQFISASNDGAVFINPIIYAELAGYADSERQMASRSSPICCWSALTFRGGGRARSCRHAGVGAPPSAGLPTSGAHALVSGMTLLTRDARRYRSYFPEVRLTAPDAMP